MACEAVGVNKISKGKQWIVHILRMSVDQFARGFEMQPLCFRMRLRASSLVFGGAVSLATLVLLYQVLSLPPETHPPGDAKVWEIIRGSVCVQC